MAVAPINIARVSQGLRMNFALQSLQRNQRELFLSQSRIATGRSFTNPSEDPLGASRAVDLTQALSRQSQFRFNLQYGDNSLAAADAAVTEINDLLVEASSIASQNVSNLTSAAERAAEAELVAGIRHQLQVVGNRQLNGRFIFGGRDTLAQPFIDDGDGITYAGDIGYRMTRVEDRRSSAVNVPGNQLFGALSRQIATNVNLTPRLTDTVRLDDISAVGGGPIPDGMLVFNEVDGAGVFRVDLRNADTIGNVITLINEAATAAGANVTASLSATGLTITPGSQPVGVTDTGTGELARALGVYSPQPAAAAIAGQALIPRVTRLTPVVDLAAGAGVDITSGLVITNGTDSATIDLSAAVTVQDIINTINNAGVSVLARISDDGTRIDVFNQVSGSALSIGENGGTTAANLGIRTFDAATPLSELNFGRGVTFVDGLPDIRVTAKNGATVDVVLDGAQTIGEVIDRINQSVTTAGVAMTASFAAVGNGIRISDSTGGAGGLSVTGLNVSTAAIELGLDVPVDPLATELVGRDVNLVRTEGILDALIELETALRADDTRGITLAGDRLDGLRNEVTRVHGLIGAGAQAMAAKRLQMEDASLTTELFLSQVRDLDYAEAVTRLQSASTTMQANLQTSAVTLNLTLLDYLR